MKADLGGGDEERRERKKPLGGLCAKRKRRDTIPDKKRSLFDLLSHQGVGFVTAEDENLAITEDLSRRVYAR